MNDEQPSSSAGDPVPPPPKPTKKKKLTRKQAKLAREVVKDPEATLSELGVKSAYRGGPGTVARELSKPHVQDRIRELMDAHPDTSLAGLTHTLRAGLKATRVRPFKTSTDDIIYAAPLVDHPTRHAYLETALELHGALDKRPRGPGSEEPPMSLREALVILQNVQVTVNVPAREPRP